MAKELIYKIHKDGRLEVETKGTQGIECQKMIQKVLNYIGAQPDDEHKKPEFWEDGRKVYTTTNQ